MVETTIELSSAEMALPGSYQGWDATKDDCYESAICCPRLYLIPEHFILMPIPNLNSGMPGYGSV